ncbi:MAG TPA: hypothetical protein PLJ35_08305 [Anaerolineae bacterium]|nr:hypothetical protein [Anaerolineae bacterium]HOQ98810.1 hypothetical protein [Anaerolineae bacterium]HPL27504.1 hypothetical protein [Anaerolineae bacterium]
MAQYLLTAEADKIQDLIFRSSHLREVVGGSQLLERFCTAATPALLDRFRACGPEVIINAGGAFRILFESGTREEVAEFGRLLAEMYARALGGHLTVAVVEAEPGEGEVGQPPRYRPLAERAESALRRAKEERGGAEASAHLPLCALCASCGVSLAKERCVGSRAELPDEADYRCGACAARAAEREGQRREFLSDYVKAARGARPELPEEAGLPEVDTLAEFDAHHYVAYMVADGNDLGVLFSHSSSAQQSRDLSDALRLAVAEGLGQAAAGLYRWTKEKAGGLLPLLPLIMAGDDVFALMPAHWALDVARTFASTFEETMAAMAGERVTVALGVLICKSSYPYALAHREATKLMEDAKRLGKKVAAECQEAVSTISFAEIAGNPLAEDAQGAKAPIWGSLRPYFVAAEGLSPALAARGAELGTLLHWRQKLQGELPTGRLQQLRALYADRPRPGDWAKAGGALRAWHARLEQLLARIAHGEEDRIAPLRQALAELGLTAGEGGAVSDQLPPAVRPDRGYWRPVWRDQSIHLAHGLPDLLAMWDYAWLLEADPAVYGGQEDER